MHCISQLLSGLYQKSDVGEIVRAVCQNVTVSCTFHYKKELQSEYVNSKGRAYIEHLRGLVKI